MKELLEILALCMIFSFTGLSIIWRIGFGHWPWKKQNKENVYDFVDQ